MQRVHMCVYFTDICNKNVDTFDQVVERLEKMDNRWSKDILSHWRTLPPRLLKVRIEIKQINFMTSHCSLRRPCSKQ